jgi:predicted HTH transcriptional regulator
MKLSEVLRAPEGKDLEFERDLSSPKGVARTLVAFANAAGGRLVVGVEDGTRNVVGVPDPLALEERIASLVADAVEPRLLPEIEMVPWRTTHVVVVTVHPSALRPHHVVADGPERGTYVRLGSTNRVADAALVAELARRTGAEGFDEAPLPDLDSEAIDFGAASQWFAERRQLRHRDLETLGLVRSYQGRMVPTVGGLLLFGRHRLGRFPDAYLQVGRFAGTERVELVDRADLTAYPMEAIAQAVAFVERNTRLGMSIGRVRRVDVPAVPPAALREALVNAVVHADYAQTGAPIRVAVFDDRVEVENPGVLLPGLTFDDLRQGVSRVRNRVIARVFKELGYVEQWGTGVRRMVAACVDAGLPEPEFAELGLRLRVTLRTERTTAPVRDDVDERIVAYLRIEDGRSTAEIAAHVGLSTRSVQQRLARLAERGVVVVVGTGPRDPRRRWHATR